MHSLSRQRVTAEKANSSMNQIISPRHQVSKELLTLQSTTSNTPLCTNLSSDFPSSVKDMNSRSITPNCKRRCPIHDISNKNRLDYIEELIRSNDKVNNHSDVAVEHTNASTVQKETTEFENCKKSMDKRTYKAADATDTQAMRFKSQSVFNHSDNIFGVSYDFLEKAIEQIAASTIPDHQNLTLAPPMEEKKCISVDHRSLDTLGTSSSMKDRVFTYSRPPEKSLVSNQRTIKSVAHGKDLLPNLSHKRNQIPRPKDGSIKEMKIKPSLNLNQIHSKSTRQQSNKSSGTANQKGSQSRDSIVQKNELLISQTTAGTRESSSPTHMRSRTKGRDQRQNAGTPVVPLLTTLGPTLMRTPTVGQHAKVDQYKHQRCASQIGNKIANQKDQPHQSIRFTTILDEKPRGRSVRPNHRRVGTQRSFYMNPTNVPSNQKAKTIMTSVSTSASSVSTTASSYSSSAAQETSSSESQESVPLRLMTRQRVAPSSKHDSKAQNAREGSMKRSRRVPTVDSPQHAGSMAHMENIEKKTGRLRRIKNKLGVIFHHHHHHHHHRHGGVEAKVGNATLSNHHHSFWKYFQKMLHHKSEEGKVKSRLRSGPCKRDTDYGLVDGLLRHIWHSKKSKRSGGIKGKGKSHNHKMKVKKWHWWQKLNKRKGVVRQTSSRKRVRFGFKAPKKHLRALKLN